MATTSLKLSEEVLELIRKYLDRGSTIELKKVKGEIVVVEIQRKVMNKTSTTG